MTAAAGIAALVLVTSCSSVASAADGQYQVQQPKGQWQVPKDIQAPKGDWQTPSEIQVPKGIQAIKVEEVKCEQRLLVVADALFAFDKADLGPDAEETLLPLGPMIQEAKAKSAVIEGHTDSVGSDDYNQRLSEHRAETIRTWLASHGYLPASTPIRGFGEKRPVAPNANPDGRDNPAGRQKNRRVEVVLYTCD